MSSLTLVKILIRASVKLVEPVLQIFAGVRVHDVKQNGDAHAVGGVNEGNIAEFLAAGICGVGVGGNLANKKWIEAGEFDKITETARNMVEIIKNA